MNTSNIDDDNDGRTTTRKKTLLKGTIVYNHRMSTMDCTIFDLSDTGARLRPVELGVLPDEFELRVLFGGTFQCRTIHRKGNQIGVRFV